MTNHANVSASLNRRHSTFIISDLHLTDSEGDASSTNCRYGLTRFLNHLSEYAKSVPTHLILNGDTVDFLSSQQQGNMMISGEAATNSLTSIINHRTCRGIFGMLQKLLTRPFSKLTIMTGNHDVELMYPGCRDLLFRSLQEGAEILGDIEVRHGDEPVIIGAAIIEHGNQYDRWNRVDYDKIRRWQYGSNGLSGFPSDVRNNPGSRLVINVINQIRQTCPFVDLLKPEDDTVLPLLAVIQPSTIEYLPSLLEYFTQTISETATKLGLDILRAFGDASAGPSLGKDPVEAARTSLQLAFSVAGVGTTGDASAPAALGEFIKIWSVCRTTADRKIHLQRLWKSLRKLHAENPWALTLEHEKEDYTASLSKRIDQGYKCIIYGHTHIPKRIDLTSLSGGLYVNTGTWCDTMALPQKIFSGTFEEAESDLQFIADEILAKRTPYRRSQLTYARIHHSFSRSVDELRLFEYHPNEAGSLAEHSIELSPQGTMS